MSEQPDQTAPAQAAQDASAVVPFKVIHGGVAPFAQSDAEKMLGLLDEARKAVLAGEVLGLGVTIAKRDAGGEEMTTLMYHAPQAVIPQMWIAVSRLYSVFGKAIGL